MKLIIPGTLPGLNDYIRACRGNRYAGAKMAREAEERVLWAATQTRRTVFTGPVRVRFHWVEPNRTRDKDNIACAKKFILDGLVTAGVLPEGDGWRGVEGFTDTFAVDKSAPRVEVTITDAAPA